VSDHFTVPRQAAAVEQCHLTYAQIGAPPELARLSKRFSAETPIGSSYPPET